MRRNCILARKADNQEYCVGSSHRQKYSSTESICSAIYSPNSRAFNQDMHDSPSADCHEIVHHSGYFQQHLGHTHAKGEENGNDENRIGDCARSLNFQAVWENVF